MHQFFTLLFIMTFMASPAIANNSCKPQPAGEVNIIWSSDAVTYDFNKSQSQLDRMDIDTKNPYDRHVQTHVGGLMQGGIALESSVVVASMTYQRQRQVCQWVDKMDIHIAINPTVFVASDYPKGTCKHRAILDHEMKHVYVDREVVKKYAPKIKKHLQKALMKVGIVGPKPLQRRGRYQKKITDYMNDQLQAISEQMYNERRKRQQAIDSKEEYDRVSNACK